MKWLKDRKDRKYRKDQNEIQRKRKAQIEKVAIEKKYWTEYFCNNCGKTFNYRIEKRIKSPESIECYYCMVDDCIKLHLKKEVNQ